MLDTGCQLISVFNEDMNATRKLTSVILTKGGLKKVAFKRLSPVYVSMGYGATNTLFESLMGKGLTKYSSTGKAKWTKEYRGSNLSCKDWRLLQGMMELSLSDKVYSRTGKARWKKEYRGSNLSCKDWRLQQGRMELSLSWSNN